MTDEEVCRLVRRGTTVRSDKLVVLYNDGAVALVKWPGVRIGCRLAHEWVPASVKKHDLGDPDRGAYWDDEEVWDCGQPNGGRLTKNRIRKLVLSLGLDPAYIR